MTLSSMFGCLGSYDPTDSGTYVAVETGSSSRFLLVSGGMLKKRRGRNEAGAAGVLWIVRFLLVNDVYDKGECGVEGEGQVLGSSERENERLMGVVDELTRSGA
jgi:hypothetical protein